MSDQESQNPAPPDWEQIEKRPAFAKLLRDKVRFIVPATIFFVIYYFALLILVGWFPEAMKKPVFGGMNLAYVFALSQFFMAWILAGLYMRAAKVWDRDIEEVLKDDA